MSLSLAAQKAGSSLAEDEHFFSGAAQILVRRANFRRKELLRTGRYERMGSRTTSSDPASPINEPKSLLLEHIERIHITLSSTHRPILTRLLNVPLSNTHVGGPPCTGSFVSSFSSPACFPARTHKRRSQPRASYPASSPIRRER